MNGITENTRSNILETYANEAKFNTDPKMSISQLEYFKYLPDETKLLIFNILRELPVDVHLPILTILDLYEELRIIEYELAELNKIYLETDLTKYKDKF